MEILDRVAAGNVAGGDFVRLQDVGWTMTDASLCGLGQTAASAVLSAMRIWPELFSKDEGARKKDERKEGRGKKVEKVSDVANASKGPKAQDVQKAVKAKAKPVKKGASRLIKKAAKTKVTKTVNKKITVKSTSKK